MRGTLIKTFSTKYGLSHIHVTRIQTGFRLFCLNILDQLLAQANTKTQTIEGKKYIFSCSTFLDTVKHILEQYINITSFHVSFV